MSFSVHGAVSFAQQGQILIADIQGPWNMELIELYKEKAAPYVQELSAKGAWGLIIDIRNEASCPQDAVEGIRRGVIEQAANWHRVCTAYVIAPDVVGYHIMDRVWRGVYKDIIPFDIFEKREQALAWVGQILQDQSGH